MSKDKWIKKRLKKYNVSLDYYETLLILQKNCCKICNKHENENIHKCLDIDHCHKSNKMRGLLCNNCNSGIAFSKENIQILKNAIEYLNKNK